jgi:1-aminocyclopropane-1-carboxylate deaminase/D-cysteine desulfhydrase-like pyridoxal-dependent ACC family enzyme
MSPADLAARLATFGARSYGVFPTPFHRLDRFSEAIGRDVWIKRDDLISVGLGGNKVRKLAYLAADARRLGADHLVSVGAEQSNHARCVASVAAMEGWGCDLVLGGDPAAPRVGNLLLDHLLGATIHMPGTESWPELERASELVARDLRVAGRNPYVMPIGGSTPIGALGLVAGYLELRTQLAQADLAPSSIVFATSSGGTQAGLAVGAHLFDDDISIVGVGVAKSSSDLQREVIAIASGCLDLLGASSVTVPASVDSHGSGRAAAVSMTESPGASSSEPGGGSLQTAPLDVLVLSGYLGTAYADPSPGGLDALRLLLRTEGILTDPVYTSKALHAVVAAATDVVGEGPIVFWHTGGGPAVFAPHFAGALIGS